MKRYAAGLAVALVLSVAGTAWAVQQPAGPDTIRGTMGNDVLRGGNSPDLIVGRAGNDRIWGNRAPDVLRGNAGNDTLHGFGSGETRDVLNGGRGHDVCIGTRRDVFKSCEDVTIRKGLGPRNH